jgi:hypothetical protein
VHESHVPSLREHGAPPSLSGFVVLSRFTMVTGGVGKMFLHLLMVFGRFLRHCRFSPGLEFACRQDGNVTRQAQQAELNMAAIAAITAMWRRKTIAPVL